MTRFSRSTTSRGVVDRCAVDLDAFRESVQVGRGIEPDRLSRRLAASKRRKPKRCLSRWCLRRAVNGLEGALRMIEMGTGRGNPLEAASPPWVPGYRRSSVCLMELISPWI